MNTEIQGGTRQKQTNGVDSKSSCLAVRSFGNSKGRCNKINLVKGKTNPQNNL